MDEHFYDIYDKKGKENFYNTKLVIYIEWEVNLQHSYSDLAGPRDMTARKMVSEVPSTTPTAIIAGWSSQCWEQEVSSAKKEKIEYNYHEYPKGNLPLHANPHLLLLWKVVTLC